MAESAVALVIDKLVSFLISRGVQWLGIGTDLRRQIIHIKDELESIRYFLRDADERADKDDHANRTGVGVWVKQVRQAAYRIEDVIDQFTAQHAVLRCGSTTKKIASSFKNSRLRRKIAAQLKDITELLEEIKKRSHRYNFVLASSPQSPAAGSGWHEHDPRVASHFVSSGELVGIEDARNRLMGWLQGDRSRREVVSVVGMGGVGKTTLAKIVYEAQSVKEHFQCSAWIAVSQTYTKEELLSNLTRLVQPPDEPSHQATFGISEEIQLISRLRGYLHGKRYLVTFDDVWNVGFWADIEHALPEDNVGSRILITTRNKDVSDFCRRSSIVHVHELQSLPPNLALELFCRKAFKFGSEGNCPQVLEKLSIEIVKRCGGLPLAIVAIAGLLSTKERSVSEWQNVHDRLRTELASNPHLANIKKILFLSYLDLPHHLKSCILYFGIFPEGYSVDAHRLIRHWITEGFVERKSDRTLEQVGEEYLIELVRRNMVQWSRIYDGVSKHCEVHGLMREAMVSRIEKMGFCQVLHGGNSSLEGESRRISICNNVGNIQNTQENFAVRSIFIFNANELPKLFVETLFVNFKLLKLLDFEEAPLDHLPESIGSLLHLESLNVRHTKLNKVPKSIGKLVNLQSLNLQFTLVRELPMQICKLQKLRHLLCGSFDPEIGFSLGSASGVRIHNRVGDLESLQTLVIVEAGDGVDLIEELMKLKELRRLEITNVTAQIGWTLSMAIDNMDHLQSLDISLHNEAQDLSFLESISNPPQSLCHLSLRGILEKLPQWIGPQLQNIVTIRLFFSKLVHDPLTPLRSLPSLAHLYLYDTSDAEQLWVEKGGFRKLKVLYLEGLERLSVLIIEKEGMPVLEELVIGPSPDMEHLPFGLSHLTNLKTLQFRQMPKQFVLKLQPNIGQGYHKVKHIKDVLFSYKVSGVHFKAFKLGNQELLEHLQRP